MKILKYLVSGLATITALILFVASIIPAILLTPMYYITKVISFIVFPPIPELIERFKNNC